MVRVAAIVGRSGRLDNSACSWNATLDARQSSLQLQLRSVFRHPLRSATALAPTSSVSPSSLCRLLLFLIITGPSSDRNQPASSDAMRCMVPRIAQVRTTERWIVRTSSTQRAVSPDARTRIARTPATASCAWIPHRSETTCRTPTCALASRRWARRRKRRASSLVRCGISLPACLWLTGPCRGTPWRRP